MGRMVTVITSTGRMVMQPAADRQISGSIPGRQLFRPGRQSAERELNRQHTSLWAAALPFNCAVFWLNVSSPVREAKPATEKN